MENNKIRYILGRGCDPVRAAFEKKNSKPSSIN